MANSHGGRRPLTLSQLRHQVERGAEARLAGLAPLIVDRPRATPAVLRKPYNVASWAALEPEARIEHARKIITGQVFDAFVAAHEITEDIQGGDYFPPVPGSRTQWTKAYKAHLHDLVNSLVHFTDEAAPSTPSALRAPHSSGEWLALGADARLRHIREKVKAELLEILPPRPAPLARDPYAAPR